LILLNHISFELSATETPAVKYINKIGILHNQYTIKEKKV